MPIFLRALSFANAVREWFSFANEAVSFFGVTKRVAAAGVIAAAVAAPVVVAKPAPTVQQLKDTRAVVQAAGSAEDTDISECATGKCSVQYLIANEGRLELAKRINHACETTTQVEQEQCAAAARVVAGIRYAEQQERRDAARRKASAEAPPVTGLKMPWEH